MTTGIQGLGGIPNPVALRKYDDFRTSGVAPSRYSLGVGSVPSFEQ
jgi:hypothetical protein